MPGAGNKRVLITGVTSVVGRKLAQQIYFDKRVDHIVGVARDERPYYFDEYEPSRFTYRTTNILKQRELTNLFLSEPFREKGVDTVIHLAFQNRPSALTAETHTLNVVGTKHLLDRCIEHAGITKFVYKSSWIVYKIRPHNPVLLDEEAELNFDQDASQWVKDRVDADMLCRAQMKNPSMNIVVMRTGPIIGRTIHSQFNAYLQSKMCPMVVGYNPMVNLLHLNDVVNALQLAIHRPVRGVFNVVGRETAPLSEFIRLAGQIAVPMPETLLRRVNQVQLRFGMTDFDFSVCPDLLKYPCLMDPARAQKFLAYKPYNHVKF